MLKVVQQNDDDDEGVVCPVVVWWRDQGLANTLSVFGVVCLGVVKHTQRCLEAGPGVVCLGVVCSNQARSCQTPSAFGTHPGVALWSCLIVIVVRIVTG